MQRIGFDRFMNKIEALEAGEVHYDSERPCKRGHKSPRFVSNGACSECVRIQRAATSNSAKAAKTKRNNALFGGLREHTIMVKLEHKATVDQLAEIFQYSPSTAIDAIKKYIATVHESCPNPRVLNRDALLKFITFEGGQVTNLTFLTIEWPTDNDPNTYIFYNFNRYDATEVMEVLRGQRLNVRPK